MRAQFLTGELFYTLQEAQILTERWRIHCTRCTSISHDRASRRTTPMWNPSMPPCDESASMHTVSSHCTKPKRASRLGGGSTTRVGLTGHCRIERQRNLPRGSQRISSASPASPLEILLRPGTEIEGRPAS